MDESRRRRIAKTAMLALVLMACDEPAKSAADQSGDGGASSRGEGIDRSGATEKSHCAGDEKQH